MVLVDAAFAAGELLLVKQLGAGLAVAMIVDAAIVRLLLVPRHHDPHGPPELLGAARPHLDRRRPYLRLTGRRTAPAALVLAPACTEDRDPRRTTRYSPGRPHLSQTGRSIPTFESPGFVWRLERTCTLGSTARHSSRFTRFFRCSAIALLVVAAGCSDYEREHHISVEDTRGAGGVLEGVTVEGEGFTPNGTVLVTFVLSATGGNDRPFIEEEIQADGNGEFVLEKGSLPCPQPADYERGSWTLVVARDMTSGISGSENLEPGQEPDCRGGG